MKRIFLLISAFCLLAATVFAQNEEARKLNEFEFHTCDFNRQALDILLTELNKFPDAEGRVIVYQGNLRDVVRGKNNQKIGDKYVLPYRGGDRRLIEYFKEHLKFRNFPAERVVFVEGGFREKFTVELWLVPDKAVSPAATPTLKKLRQRKPIRSELGCCGGS